MALRRLGEKAVIRVSCLVFRENRLVGIGVAQPGKTGGAGSFKAVIRVS